MKRFLIAVLMMLTSTAGAEVTGEVVRYRDGGVEMHGYIAWEKTRAGRRPGVLVVHEWWGHNEYARRRARMLAALGYTALAVDMYGGGRQATHPDNAAAFAAEVTRNWDIAEQRFRAALKVLRAHPTVDPQRIAAIGYCFGGGVVLEMARRGVDLRGVASFHGSLVTEHPARPGAVKAAIIVFNGGDDPFVKPEHIEAFKREMKAAGADFTFISYAGARHSFTNPEADVYGKRFNLPLAYDPEADRQSWHTLQQFLKRVFR